jgi:hypothetical protein
VEIRKVRVIAKSSHPAKVLYGDPALGGFADAIKVWFYLWVEIFVDLANESQSASSCLTGQFVGIGTGVILRPSALSRPKRPG